MSVEGIDFKVDPELNKYVSKVFVDYAEAGIRMGFSVKKL